MPLSSSHTTNSTFYSSAPLPSPTSTATAQHFCFPTSSNQLQPQLPVADQESTSNQYLHPQSQQQQQQQPHTQSPELQQGGAATASNQAQGAILPSQDPSSPLRRDFGLLAEAAKRAQMAVITRDLGEVGL